MAIYETYLHYSSNIYTEWQQMRDEGRPVDFFREECLALSKEPWSPSADRRAFLLSDAMALEPVSALYPFVEPSTLPEIRAERPASAKTFSRVPFSPAKVLAAWQGRVAGCLLGKPVEGMRRNTLYPLLKAGNNFPLSRYIKKADYPDPAEYEKVFFNPDRCWADTLDGIAPVDDDTNYTVLALKILEDYGRDFTPTNVMEAWTRYLPMCALCTAERVAYRNAALSMTPPETAVYRNAYREWIGAQIRGDFFGYINPGDPETAAEYAWRDASISHVKNGIYGEMYIAAMLAAAAVEEDVDAIIDAGLAQIPAKSRLARDIADVREWCGKMDAYAVMERIHERYDEHSQHGWCHTDSNAMIVTMALIKGEWDYGKSVCLAVHTGFDTDCNGATVGSIVGMRNGCVPEEWVKPFKDGLRTSLDGYPVVSLEELAEKTCAF